MSRSFEERQREMCRVYNNLQGTLNDGFDCPVCKNKGYKQYCDEIGEIKTKLCECALRRKTIRLIRRSGLAQILPRYTFDSYLVSEPWQQLIKQKAEEFTKDENARCFFIGGQSGSGKTHICTAICGSLIEQNRSVLYVLWRDFVAESNAAMNSDGYSKIMERYRNIDVLYIDDLFKTKSGTTPSPADVTKAFDIINWRSLKPEQKTIISTEHTLPRLMEIDEATGGRIYEMTGSEYRTNISKDIGKNMRLRDG